MRRARILIADDHTLVAELCKKLLETEFEVVGTVNNGRSLVQAAMQFKPELIIVDVSMPLLNGLDAARQVRDSLPDVKLIFLTMINNAEVAAAAFREGASAYVLKTCTTGEMLTAVRNVVKGKSYLSPSICKDTVHLLQRQQKRLGLVDEERLTERQREVLQLLAEGKVMKEVGDILNMSTRTVAFHKYRIMEVLGASSSADLVKYAVKNHMVA